MDNIEKLELKQFIRDNLEILVEPQYSMGDGNNQIVGLRFVGDKECFAEEIVYIPDGDL